MNEESSKVSENAENNIERLNKIIEEQRREIEKLEQVITEKEKQNTELAGKVADNKVQEQLTRENTEKLDELKRGNYAPVIKDLFEKPEKKLVSRATLATLYFTIFSIAVSSLITYYFSRGSSEESVATFSKIQGYFDKSQKEATQNTEQTQESIKEIYTSLSKEEQKQKAINQLVQYMLNDEELKEEFPGFKRNKNELIMLYKMKLVNKFTHISYDVCLEAFKETGVDNNNLPKSPAEILSWDLEMINLCKNAIKNINSVSDINKKPKKGEMYFNHYKTAGDNTDYKNWKCINIDSYPALTAAFKYKLEYFIKQVKYNKKEAHLIGG
jgi:hypothetical protein